MALVAFRENRRPEMDKGRGILFVIYAGRATVSPMDTGMFPLGGVSISDDMDVHGIRIMPGTTHITGRLGTMRVTRRGRHGGRSLTRGTVEEHWITEREGGRKRERERGLTVDRRADRVGCVAEKISEGSTADRMDGTMPKECMCVCEGRR